MRGSRRDNRWAAPSVTRGRLARTCASTEVDTSSATAAATPSDLVRMDMCTGEGATPDSRRRPQPALDTRASLDRSAEEASPVAANQLDLVGLGAVEHAAVREH